MLEIVSKILPQYSFLDKYVSWIHGIYRSGEPFNKNKKKDGFIMSELTEDILGYFLDFIEDLLNKSKFITLSVGIPKWKSLV